MFDNLAFVAIVAGVWLAIGLFLSLVMARRGHNGFGWLVVGTLFGPLAFVLAVDAGRHDEELKPLVIREARNLPGSGVVDVLAGYDASPEADQAIDAVVRLLGDRLGRLTVATVVAFDHVTGAEQKARAELEQLADAGSAGTERITDLEVLHGRPSEALRQLALDGSYDLITVGARGAGLSKLIIGSTAGELAAGGKVPVLVAG